MSILLALYNVVKKLTIEEVCWLLYMYGCENAQVYLYGTKQWDSSKHFAESLIAPRYKATQVTGLGFWGGPPPIIKWFRGCLAAFVTDQILSAHYNQGADIHWLVTFEANTITSTLEQLKTRAPLNLRPSATKIITAVPATALENLDKSIIKRRPYSPLMEFNEPEAMPVLWLNNSNNESASHSWSQSGRGVVGELTPNVS